MKMERIFFIYFIRLNWYYARCFLIFSIGFMSEAQMKGGYVQNIYQPM